MSGGEWRRRAEEGGRRSGAGARSVFEGSFESARFGSIRIGFGQFGLEWLDCSDRSCSVRFSSNWFG